MRHVAMFFPGIKSFYRWENEVKNCGGGSTGFKNQKNLCSKKLQHRVEQLHSYEKPCIVSIDINEGSEAFVNWVEKSTA